MLKKLKNFIFSLIKPCKHNFKNSEINDVHKTFYCTEKKCDPNKFLFHFMKYDILITNLHTLSEKVIFRKFKYFLSNWSSFEHVLTSEKTIEYHDNSQQRGKNSPFPTLLRKKVLSFSWLSTCNSFFETGDFLPEEVPQIVLLTFDDSVNDLNKGLYADLFEKGRKNPNGCPISATFYVSHEWTDYGQVQNLYASGHEIASHTIS